MANNLKFKIHPMGYDWHTFDPFIYCVHHLDYYPAGDGKMGPAASLDGRMIGSDFTIKDGWRMYHGDRIPGFPVHPHRGFETVTIVLQGFVDHHDSAGGAGRYGNGDVQWMTAGSGLQHAEMFPLVNDDKPNTTELFQIWLNLPASKKFAKPHYKMLWGETIPNLTLSDHNGKKTLIKIIAGAIGNVRAPEPAPDSWAADPKNDIAIWDIRMEPEASWKIPPSAHSKSKRMLYFIEGGKLKIAGNEIDPMNAIELPANQEIEIINSKSNGRYLLLQGKPINEPVAQYGPFVMNTSEEIEQAYTDYRATKFGGWPWENNDQVHPKNQGRIAKYSDGSIEKPMQV